MSFYTPAPRRGRGYTVLPLYVCPFVGPPIYPFFRPSNICFVSFFSVTVDGRNLIFGHKRHIGMLYCGYRLWTRQIPTSCLPIFLDFYKHLTCICICTLFVAFFSATIDDMNLIFGHKLHIGMPYCGKSFWTRQIPTSCLPT